MVVHGALINKWTPRSHRQWWILAGSNWKDASRCDFMHAKDGRRWSCRIDQREAQCPATCMRISLEGSDQFTNEKELFVDTTSRSTHRQMRFQFLRTGCDHDQQRAEGSSGRWGCNDIDKYVCLRVRHEILAHQREHEHDSQRSCGRP